MDINSALIDERLDLPRKLYQESIWPEISKVAAGQKLPGPLVVELDCTTLCDLACPECISGRLLNNGGFTSERLEQLAHEFIVLGVRAVILIGGGEPLVHPATGKIIQILGSAGLSVGITTNGTLIHKHLGVIADFAHWTRVSLDAGTPQMYKRFRPHKSGGNVFHAVIRNMRSLSKRKKGILGYSFLLITRINSAGEIIETNYTDVGQAGMLAKDIGCDYFEVKPMYDMRHFLVKQEKKILSSLRDQLDELQKTETNGFKIIAPQTLKVIQSSSRNVEPKEYHHCRVAELRTLVTPHGVFVCPYYRGVRSKNFGDPATSSFVEIWRSSERQRVTAATDPSRECQFHCIRHRSNIELDSIGAGNPRLRVIADYDLFI